MFSLIRRMFGMRAAQRSSSGEPVSKRKSTNGSLGKRPLSIDSKKKEQDELLLTKQKNPIQIYQELDDVATMKKSMGLNPRQMRKVPQIPNFEMFEDLSDEGQQFTQDLLTNLGEKSLIQFHTNQKDTNHPHSQFNTENQQRVSTHCAQFQRPIRQGKIARKPYKRVASPKKLKKINHTCALCHKSITEQQQSLKLACIHRFHEQCGIKMRERNRWDCDMCEVKNKSRGSIMNLAKKGRGVFSIRGSSIGR